MTVEQWKPVVGFEGRYEVSDQGRIRSVERRVQMRVNGAGATKLVKSRVLVTKIAKDGYVRLSLKDASGKMRLRYMHRLVLESFVGLCPLGMEACHADGDRSNNHLSNLRWDTRVSNHADKIKHGTTAVGERNKGGGKLTKAQALEIRRRLSDGEVGTSLAKEFGVSNTMITKIRHNELWVS